MKRKVKSGSPLGAKVRGDKRLSHGLDSKAVKRFRSLDREVRNSSHPTPEMCYQLGAAYVEALKIVSRATDVTNFESRAKYSSFVSSTSKTRRFLGEEGSKTVD